VVFDTYAATLDASGSLVGTAAPVFTPDGEGRTFPRVAYDGVGYGLTYIHHPSSGDRTARFARLDASGDLVAGSDVALSASHRPHNQTDIAWSPSRMEFGAIFDGTTPLGGGFVNHHLYFVRVDDTGAVSSTAIQLDTDTSTTSPGYAQSLVWNGSSFASAWTEYTTDRVRLGEIDSTDAVTRTLLGELGGASPLRVAVHTNGAEYVIAWMDEVLSSESSIHTARADFGPAYRAGSEEVVGDLAAHSDTPTVWLDPAGTLYVAWAEDDRIWLARVSPSGVVTGPTAITAPSGSNWHGFANFVPAGGCGFALTYQDIGTVADNRMIFFTP
jgi:hypothetical protein